MTASELMALKVPSELFGKVRATAHRLSLFHSREIRWTMFVKDSLERAVHQAEQEMGGPHDGGYRVREA